MLGEMADLRATVAAKLAEMTPYLERSGARVDLIGVEDGVAQVKVWLTRSGPACLVTSIQLKSGVERLLRDRIPELRGVEALNLPPYELIGWDQPSFAPVELPVESAPKA